MRISDGIADVCSSDLFSPFSPRRRGENGENGGGEGGNGESVAMENGGELSPQRLEELAAGEQFILSVAADGYGKRPPAYEYRLTGRGGQGLGNLDLSRASRPQARLVPALPGALRHQHMPCTPPRNLPH